MKVLKIIGIIILVLIAIIVILGLIAPKEYSVERTVIVDAPKELVFNYVKYWRNWHYWSPWLETDSTMTVTIEGTDGEVGSIYKWNGDPKLTGSGELINTGVTKYSEMTARIRFIEPFPGEADGYVRLSDEDGSTKVAWGMYGKDKFPWNIPSLFMDIDAMVGKDYERGLELLKMKCEDEYRMISQYTIDEVGFPATMYAAVKEKISFDQIPGFYEQSFAKILAAVKSENAKTKGAPVGLYYIWDEQNMTTEMAAAIPVNKKVSVEDVEPIEVPAVNAFKIDYYGAYEDIAPAYNALDLYFAMNNLTLRVPVVEEYVTDPQTEPDTAKWLTRVYFFAE